MSGERDFDMEPQQRPVVPFVTVDPIRLQGLPVPERRWIVPDWIPRGVVTGLYGAGGLGKTLLAQQLMTAAAIGGRWLGLPVEPVKTLAIFCEDSADELHRRQADINRLFGCDFGDLENMRWSARTGHDNIMMTFEGGLGITSDFFGQVLVAARKFGAELVIVDTVADTFGGNENDRSQARQFVQAGLGSIAREIDGAVVALAHPSRAGMGDGTGQSGSTGWDASFRSRLYMSKPDQEEGEAPDPDARMLARVKANYAARDESVAIRWKEGVFVTEHQSTGIIASIERRVAERVFLDLLDAMTREDRPLSENSRSGNYAPKLFATRPEREGYRKPDFARAMESLFAQRLITTVEYGRTGDFRRKIARVAPPAEEAA